MNEFNKMTNPWKLTNIVTVDENTWDKMRSERQDMAMRMWWRRLPTPTRNRSCGCNWNKNDGKRIRKFVVKKGRKLRWPTTVTSKPNAHSKLQIAQIKFKSLTANSNRSQQIQIAHSELQITHSKLQIAHSKFKSPTANSNRSQQIKVAHSKFKFMKLFSYQKRYWVCIVYYEISSCNFESFTWHDCFSSFVVAHPMSCCIPNVLLHTQYPIEHLMSCCTTNVLLHTQYPIEHLMSCCTSNVLLHTYWPVAHLMSCCTPNVQRTPEREFMITYCWPVVARLPH